MIAYSHTLSTQASMSDIWELWTEVDNWSKWDIDIEDADILGDLEVGSVGYLKPINRSLTKFTIIESSYQNSFTTRVKLPFTKMDFVHKVKLDDDHLQLTHSIIFKGLFSFIFGRTIGKKLDEDLHSSMENLLKQATQLEH